MQVSVTSAAEQSVKDSFESVNDIGRSVTRKTSCHQLSFIKLFQFVSVLFLLVHVFIQPTSAIRLQVHKVTGKPAAKRGGNFGWAVPRSPEYTQFEDHNARKNSGFGGMGPFSAWNLDSSRAAVPEYESVGAMEDTQNPQGGLAPSVALYLTENLLAKYVAQQDKLEQQRKRAAFMDEVFGLH